MHSCLQSAQARTPSQRPKSTPSVRVEHHLARFVTSRSVSRCRFEICRGSAKVATGLGCAGLFYVSHGHTCRDVTPRDRCRWSEWGTVHPSGRLVPHSLTHHLLSDPILGCAFSGPGIVSHFLQIRLISCKVKSEYHSATLVMGRAFRTATR